MPTPVAPPTLEDAIALAATAHRAQVYPVPGGEPFILHPLRVMLGVEGDVERVVAVLHDVVEDTVCTLDDLRQAGYPGTVVDALDLLTHRDGETYEAYIGRVAADPIARRVKLADLADNLATNRRLASIPDTRGRIERYERARHRLRSTSDTQG